MVYLGQGLSPRLSPGGSMEPQNGVVFDREAMVNVVFFLVRRGACGRSLAALTSTTTKMDLFLGL